MLTKISACAGMTTVYYSLFHFVFRLSFRLPLEKQIRQPENKIAFSGCLMGLAVAQFATQDFAHVGFGQFVAELNIARHFVACELGAAVGDEFIGG